MSHDSTLHPCAYPGCTRWALYNDIACVVHAGLVPAAPQPNSPRRGNGRASAQFPLQGALPPAGGAPGGHLTWPASAVPLDPAPAPNPAQQLALVIAHRDSLDRYIRLSLGYRTRPLTEELAYLRLLSGLAKDLAAALSRRSDIAGMDELDRFLDEVAKEARESPHWHTDDPYGLGAPPVGI